jgi:hypothetical protein
VAGAGGSVGPACHGRRVCGMGNARLYGAVAGGRRDGLSCHVRQWVSRGVLACLAEQGGMCCRTIGNAYRGFVVPLLPQQSAGSARAGVFLNIGGFSCPTEEAPLQNASLALCAPLPTCRSRVLGSAPLRSNVLLCVLATASPSFPAGSFVCQCPSHSKAHLVAPVLELLSAQRALLIVLHVVD